MSSGLLVLLTCKNEEVEVSEDLTIAPPWHYQRTRIYRGIAVFEKLMVHNNSDIDLVSDNEYTNLAKSCPFILKIWSKIKVLRQSRAITLVNLRKTKIYNTNVDLVNDNVCTKFGLNLSIRSQDME